jgi:hypothetical protein
MEYKEQDVLLGAEPQERGAQDGILGQIEGPKGLLRGQAPGARLAFGGSRFGELDYAQVQSQARGNDLFRPAVAGLEASAQDFVAVEDGLKGLPEGGLVK